MVQDYGYQIGYNCGITVKISTEFINIKKVKDNISLGDLVLYAIAHHLKDYPEFNSYFDEKTIIYPNINIGYSIKILEKQPKKVVIKDADKKSWMEISDQIKKFAFLYMRDKLMEEDTQGATISLLNFSSFNAYNISTPLYTGQSALISIASEHEINNSKFFNLCLAYDVRVADCQRALDFLNAVKETLENEIN